MRMAAYAFCLLSLAATRTALFAQALRRNDVITFNDRLKCAEPHRYGTIGGLVPESRGIVRVTPAVTGALIKRYRPDRRSADALAQIRVEVASMRACADAWTLHTDLLLADAGDRGGVVEGTSPSIPFGHRGDNGREAIGGLLFFAGASSSRTIAYDPALDLSRETWAGATLRFDLPTSIWLPGLGRGLIVVHVFASAQGDYAWDQELRKVRGKSVVPHYNLSLPITVLRALPLHFFQLSVAGLGYNYERIEQIAPGQRLERHMAGLTTSWFAKHLDVTANAGFELVEGKRVYRAFGLSIKPAICSFCQRPF